MDKKFSKLLEPGFGLYFLVFLLFACISVFFSVYEAVIELVICGILYLSYLYSQQNRKKEMVRYLENLSNSNVDFAASNSITSIPMPILVAVASTGQIVWCNEMFDNVCSLSDGLFEQSLGDIIPGFDSAWLMEGRNEYPSEVLVEGRYYRLFGNLFQAEDFGAEAGNRALMTLYWQDCTSEVETRLEYDASRLVVAIISIDNYEELVKNASDSEKATLLAAIDNRIGTWTEGIHGVLRKYDRDRYIFMMETRNLEKIVEGKFSVLEAVRDIVSRDGINATLSIGIGRDGQTLKDKYDFAMLALDMALSRGGDQAVIKNRYAFEFFGGVAKEVEKRSKVKSRVMANALGQMMRDSSQIFVMGHGNSDIDSVGSAVGVACAAKSRAKDVHIILRRANTLATPLLDRLCAEPEYDEMFIEPERASAMIDANSMLVVVDTNRPDFVEEPSLLARFRRVAVIDHHRRAATYIENCSVNMHEPSASSASELVSELLQYMVPNQTISRLEAESLLAGIHLDTKGFSVKAGVRTFEAAAYLRRAGADMTAVKRMFQNSFDEYMQKERVITCAQPHPGGIVVAVPDFETSRPVAAQAADELLNIIGVKGSIVAFPLRGDIVVSARSMGAINVQVISEMLGGGGSLTAAGAQLKDTTPEQAKVQIEEAITRYLEQNSQEESEL